MYVPGRRGFAGAAFEPPEAAGLGLLFDLEPAEGEDVCVPPVMVRAWDPLACAGDLDDPGEASIDAGGVAPVAGTIGVRAAGCAV